MRILRWIKANNGPDSDRVVWMPVERIRGMIRYVVMATDANGNPIWDSPRGIQLHTHEVPELVLLEEVE